MRNRIRTTKTLEDDNVILCLALLCFILVLQALFSYYTAINLIALLCLITWWKSAIDSQTNSIMISFFLQNLPEQSSFLIKGFVLDKLMRHPSNCLFATTDHHVFVYGCGYVSICSRFTQLFSNYMLNIYFCFHT